MRNYPWPASRIDGRLMALLHATRERERPRKPITVLVADAVREMVEKGSRNQKEEEVHHAEIGL